MATTYKILSQTAPAATNPTLSYGPVGTGLAAVLSTISVCNRSTTAATYRISFRASGDGESTKQFLVYDASISGNTTVTYSLGVTLAATDAVWVYASAATLSFQVFGSEVSI